MTWKCRILGHKFENWAGKWPGYCLRCGLEPVAEGQEVLLPILEVLRLAPIYALKDSRFRDDLGPDFKPHKWDGYEREFAERANTCYRDLVRLMTKGKRR